MLPIKTLSGYGVGNNIVGEHHVFIADFSDSMLGYSHHKEVVLLIGLKLVAVRHGRRVCSMRKQAGRPLRQEDSAVREVRNRVHVRGLELSLD